MKLQVLAVLAAILAAAPIVQAQAGDQVTTTDIRCLVVTTRLADSTDATTKQAAFMGAIYFWGRLEARGVPANLDDRVVEEIAKMSPDSFGAYAKTCGAMVSASGDALSALGDRLQKRGAQFPAS